jgi:hypothetical protein
MVSFSMFKKSNGRTFSFCVEEGAEKINGEMLAGTCLAE